MENFGERSQIIHGENLEVLSALPADSVDLVYIDPPFNTGKSQRYQRVKTVRDDAGDRTGFKGERYSTIRMGSRSFADSFDDFLDFIEPRLIELRRVLSPCGSLIVHLDNRESHYCKVLLDQLMGRECFMNEIIWAYDYGGRPRRRWPAKHDSLLWYVMDRDHYTFHLDGSDRIPYMAPGLVGAEKAARGKTPTDVWWHTIVPTKGNERTGYPTQKPLGILRRIIAVHTAPGDLVLDCFAGSGTTGEAAARADRRFVMIEQEEEAVQIMAQRLAFADPECVGFSPLVTGESEA